MLYEIKEKVKSFWEEYASDIMLAVAVFLVGMIGFGLGRLSIIMPEKMPLRITEQTVPAGTEERKGGHSNGEIVASKSGSVYYLPWCANSIKEENKVVFASKTDAENAGYRLAKNCSQ